MTVPNPFRPFIRVGALLLIAAAPVLSSGFAAPTQAAGKSLVFDTAVGVSSLDPVNPLGYPSGYEALFLIGDGLVRFNSKMKPIPDLATKWSVKPDHKTWVFTLRKGVRFSDGSRFTAQSVKADFDRMLDPTSDPTQQAIWSNFASVRVINTYTIAIKTKVRFAATLLYLSHGSAVILKVPSDPKTISTNPVGTGPYKLSSMTPGTEAVFKPNPHFWGGKPKLQQITFRGVPNPETRIADLRSGGAQLVDQVPAADLPAVKGDSNMRVQEAPTWVTTYLEFNTAHGPLANKNVRQAIVDIIDTKGIARSIFHNDADTIGSPLAPTMPGYIEAHKPKVDRKAALALLKKAGYTLKGGKLQNSSGQMKLVFTAPTGQYPNDTQVAQVIQQEVQSLGIDVSLSSVPAASWIATVRTSTPTTGYGDMYLWAFNPSNGDPDYTLSINFGKPGTDAALWNHSFVNIPRAQKLMTQAAAAVNHKKWLALVKQIQILINNAQPCAWLYVPRNNVAMSKNVTGLSILKVQFLILRDIALK